MSLTYAISNGRTTACATSPDPDLEALRCLAWCVQRGRYSAEPVRIDGAPSNRERIVVRPADTR